jgi:thioredoxin-related protein
MRINKRLKITAYLEEEGTTYPALLATDEVLEAYEIRGVPHFFVIDRKGSIAFSHVGFLPGMEEEWEWYLEDLKNRPSIKTSQ